MKFHHINDASDFTGRAILELRMQLSMGKSTRVEKIVIAQIITALAAADADLKNLITCMKEDRAHV